MGSSEVAPMLGPRTLKALALRTIFPEGIPRLSLRATGDDTRRYPAAIHVHNRTVGRRVDVSWADSLGRQRVVARQLVPGSWVEVNTFVGHPFVAEDCDTGQQLHLNGQPVHWPRLTVRQGAVVRYTVDITTPLWSLTETCLSVVRRLVPRHAARLLDIPATLRRDVHPPEDVYRQRYFYILEHAPGLLPPRLTHSTSHNTSHNTSHSSRASSSGN